MSSVEAIMEMIYATDPYFPMLRDELRITLERLLSSPGWSLSNAEWAKPSEKVRPA